LRILHFFTLFLPITYHKKCTLHPVSHSSRPVGYSGDVDHEDVDSNGTFNEWDTDRSVDLNISLGDSGDVQDGCPE